MNSFNNVSNVVEIDSQYWSYNMLLKTSGTIYVNGKGYLSNIKTIGMTQAATYCAVTEAGFIYCWGNNTVGQLGTGEYATSPYPVEVLLPESFYTNLGVPKMIRAGGEHSLVVTLENGVNKVVVFGNSNTDSYLPAYLKGIGGSGEFSGVIKKASSQCSTITENGIDRVICFGNGTNGFLGDGTTTSKTYPVYVKGVNGESEKLEGTLSGGVILSDGGKVALWGHNGYGQLGNQEYGIRNGTNEQGTTVLSDRYSSVPVLVQDRDSYLDAENPLTGAVEAVKSSYFTCAIMQDSTVKCWGKGGKYLGNQTDSNSTVGSLRPVTVIVDNDETPLSGVTQLTIQGGVIVYALKSDGSVVRWGTGISKRPVAFSSLSSGVKKIASGGSHTCAIVTENGRDILKCWGSNDSGQLGDKTFTDRTTPVTVVGVNGDTDKLINVTDVGCGNSHTCAIANDKVYCWGNATYGKTGVKDYSVSTPTLLPALYEISGTVYVADGTTPMAGALVYAGKLGSVTTGSSGTYSITVPYGNEYEISVNKTDLSFKVQGEEISTLTGTMASSNQTVSFIAQGLCSDGGTAGVDCVTCRDDLDCEANFHCENNGLVTSSCVADPPPCSSNALFDSIGNVCTSGFGVCKRIGTYYCSGISYTSDVECSATPKWSAVTTEICDTLDNDCDGEVDEDYVCDIDRDGVPNSEDKCPNLDDKATFTYTGENEVYYGNTYRNDEDMDEDGVVNCQDECVDDLPEEDLFLDFSLDFHIKTGCEVTPKGGITPTVTPTITSTFTASNTFTNTNTPTITPTSTKTFTETFTKTSTPTIAFTKTNTVTNTFTNTNTPTITDTFTATKTFTNTPTITDTFTSTFTLSNTITKTLTPTFTNTVTPEKLKIVTPETRLKKPVEVKRVKNHVRMKFEAFDGASLDDLLAKDLNINYQYLIHIRKLKRLGNKDKNYQFGRKKLSLQKSNIKTFKNLDKGIYSVRYRIVIKKNNITRKTKWSGRNLIVF